MSANPPADAADRYRLVIRAAAAGATPNLASPAEGDRDAPRAPAADTAGLPGRLARVPQLEQVDTGRYQFGGRDAHGVMDLEIDSGEVRVFIPRGWVPSRGPQVFALVFMVAEWLGWDVLDLQLGSILKKETVLQGMVAMRQAEMSSRGAHVPTPRLRGDPEGAGS